MQGLGLAAGLPTCPSLPVSFTMISKNHIICAGHAAVRPASSLQRVAAKMHSVGFGCHCAVAFNVPCSVQALAVAFDVPCSVQALKLAVAFKIPCNVQTLAEETHLNTKLELSVLDLLSY